MRRFLPRYWPGTCLLVAVLTCGCQHNRSCCTPSGGAPAEVTMGDPVAVPSDSAPAATDAVNGGETAPAQPSFVAVPVNGGQTGPELPPAATTPAMPASLPSNDPLLNMAPPAYPAGTNAQPRLRQLSPISYRQEQTAALPAISSPAGSRFGHDANYHWLVGTLDYSRIQQAWLLRYVPVEQEDRYGGCVTLVAPNNALHFQRGQTVRVEGSLIDPESQQLRPAFQVQNIRAEEP